MDTARILSEAFGIGQFDEDWLRMTLGEQGQGIDQNNCGSARNLMRLTASKISDRIDNPIQKTVYEAVIQTLIDSTGISLFDTIVFNTSKKTLMTLQTSLGDFGKPSKLD